MRHEVWESKRQVCEAVRRSKSLPAEVLEEQLMHECMLTDEPDDRTFLGADSASLSSLARFFGFRKRGGGQLMTSEVHTSEVRV